MEWPMVLVSQRIDGHKAHIFLLAPKYTTDRSKCTGVCNRLLERIQMGIILHCHRRTYGGQDTALKHRGNVNMTHINYISINSVVH